jgi:hypothetical protein
MRGSRTISTLCYLLANSGPVWNQPMLNFNMPGQVILLARGISALLATRSTSLLSEDN